MDLKGDGAERENLRCSEKQQLWLNSSILATSTAMESNGADDVLEANEILLSWISHAQITSSSLRLFYGFLRCTMAKRINLLDFSPTSRHIYPLSWSQ